MNDKDAKFQVEYVKNPDNIDDAVDEVVNFIEVRRMQGKVKRVIEPQSSGSDIEIVDRVQKTFDKAHGKKPAVAENSSKEMNVLKKQLESEKEELQKRIKDLESWSDVVKEKYRRRKSYYENKNKNQNQNQNQNQNRNQNQNQNQNSNPIQMQNTNMHPAYYWGVCEKCNILHPPGLCYQFPGAGQVQTKPQENLGNPSGPSLK